MMDAAERQARGQSRRRRHMGSITWGNRYLGALNPLDSGSGFDVVMQQNSVTPVPFPGNPDTLPGAWPGLNTQPPAITATTLPAQVPQTNPSAGNPVVVTPTSGTIPPPATVAAGTAPVPWLEQSLIGGIQNKWLLLGGLGAFLAFGGKHS
jgi:hypothetical protein